METQDMWGYGVKCKRGDGDEVIIQSIIAGEYQEPVTLTPDQVIEVMEFIGDWWQDVVNEVFRAKQGD